VAGDASGAALEKPGEGAGMLGAALVCAVSIAARADGGGGDKASRGAVPRGVAVEALSVRVALAAEGAGAVTVEVEVSAVAGWLRAGAVAAGALGGWAWRVTVPPRLKFWRSRGPTESFAGGVCCGGTDWANAGAAPSARLAAANTVPKRNPALIRSRARFD
jgi:hypothetical protein